MTTKPKTIRGTRAAIGAWLTALRSGKYQQGYGMLFSTRSNKAGYCCLGVMQKAITGSCESAPLPTASWLAQHPEIEFGGIKSDLETVILGGHASYYKDPYVTPDVLVNVNGSAARIYSLWKLNDELKWDFNKIADVIEEHVEYTD